MECFQTANHRARTTSPLHHPHHDRQRLQRCRSRMKGRLLSPIQQIRLRHQKNMCLRQRGHSLPHRHRLHLQQPNRHVPAQMLLRLQPRQLRARCLISTTRQSQGNPDLTSRFQGTRHCAAPRHHCRRSARFGHCLGTRSRRRHHQLLCIGRRKSPLRSVQRHWSCTCLPNMPQGPQRLLSPRKTDRASPRWIICRESPRLRHRRRPSRQPPHPHRRQQ